jgi:glycosyltransferase involved in cell wall biosynthesis
MIERRRALLLFTSVFVNGGIQRFNQTLLDACAEIGQPCRVLSLNDTPDSINGREQSPGISITGFAGNRWRFALGIWKALVREPYGHVLIGHVNFLVIVCLAVAASRRRAPRSLLVAHGIEVWSHIDGLRRRAMRRIDRVLCVSDYTRQRIIDQVPGIDAGRLTVFPNALARIWRRIAPILPPRPFPDRFILSVTRLEPGDRYKGIASVIEAFSMLEDQSLHYLVVGQGSDVNFLQAVAEHHGVEGRVHFLPGISDTEMATLYQKCEAFVLPSGKEGFGIVFLEAMFFGAPVIAAHEKGAIDVVRDGETGLAVRFGDSTAIKDAIERLSTDSELRTRVCEGGRSLVGNGGAFTFERFVDRSAEAFGIPVRSDTLTRSEVGDAAAGSRAA